MKKTVDRETLRKDIRPSVTVSGKSSGYKFDYETYVYAWRIDGDASGIRAFEGNIQENIDKGWEVCYGEGSIKSDQPTASDSAENRVPAPVVRILKNGETSVLMRCLKETDTANRLADAKKDDDRYERAAGAKVTRRGNEITVVDSEINPNT